MGQKRPTVRLDPEIIERARELRRGGATFREIAAALGCSRSAIAEHLARDREVALAPAALEAETVELATKVDGIVDNAASILNAQLADVARKVKGEPGSPYVNAKDLREVRLTILELRRLVELLRGRPTARTARSSPATRGSRPRGSSVSRRSRSATSTSTLRRRIS
ncbi:MAG TPA: hypothetical protein VHF22_01745 [Planctomycetota bacterium]|nr:hypothetical protein [Planctomycetota bacterium]